MQLSDKLLIVSEIYDTCQEEEITVSLFNTAMKY